MALDLWSGGRGEEIRMRQQQSPLIYPRTKLSSRYEGRFENKMFHLLIWKFFEKRFFNFQILNVKLEGGVYWARKTQQQRPPRPSPEMPVS